MDAGIILCVAAFAVGWIDYFFKEVIFVDFEMKKQLETARKILEDLRESL